MFAMLKQNKTNTNQEIEHGQRREEQSQLRHTIVKGILDTKTKVYDFRLSTTFWNYQKSTFNSQSFTVLIHLRLKL